MKTLKTIKRIDFYMKAVAFLSVLLLVFSIIGRANASNEAFAEVCLMFSFILLIIAFILKYFWFKKWDKLINELERTKDMELLIEVRKFLKMETDSYEG